MEYCLSYQYSKKKVCLNFFYLDHVLNQQNSFDTRTTLQHPWKTALKSLKNPQKPSWNAWTCLDLQDLCHKIEVFLWSGNTRHQLAGTILERAGTKNRGSIFFWYPGNPMDGVQVTHINFPVFWKSDDIIRYYHWPFEHLTMWSHVADRPFQTVKKKNKKYVEKWRRPPPLTSPAKRKSS